jgi:hypothetical protein
VRGRAAYEGVLVASAEVKPEPTVRLHRSCNFESDEVHSSSRSLVDQELPRLGLPVVRVAGGVEEAPNRVGGYEVRGRISLRGEEARRMKEGKEDRGKREGNAPESLLKSGQSTTPCCLYRGASKRNCKRERREQHI